jgi:hypothetical protein
MATQRSASSAPSQAKPQANPDEEMKSPFIPLLWLLVPFVALLVYGFVTTPR